MHRTIIYYLLFVASLFTITLSEFDPYADNSGTTVGLAGRDYCIIAADTRLSDSYMIRSRNQTKIFNIGNVCLSGSGCWSDINELFRVLRHKADVFQWENSRSIQIKEMSYLLSATLYKRRFFPYYCFSLLAGLDESGCGAVYRYDAVGSFERVRAVCAGKGERLIQPILDELSEMEADEALWDFSTNQIVTSNTGFVDGDDETDDSTQSIHSGQSSKPSISSENAQLATSSDAQKKYPISFVKDIDVEDACSVVLRAFRAAAEREISVGDGVDVWILRSNAPSVNEEDQKVDSTQENQDDVVKTKRKSLIQSVLSRNRNIFVEKRFYKLPTH